MSELKIYKSKITPDRNALVEDIASYLSSLTPTISDATFQYQKLGLDLKIKITANQEKVGKSIGNYCSIKQDNKTYYYFILKSKWISKEAIELVLSIDSINTFQNDFTFNKKTTIERQHKERFSLRRAEVVFDLYQIEGLSNLIIGDIYVVRDGYIPTNSFQAKLIDIEDEDPEDDYAVLVMEPTGAGTYWGPVEDDAIELLDYNATSVFNALINSEPTHVTRKMIRKIDMKSEGLNPVLYHDVDEDEKLADSQNDIDWYLVYKSHSDGENQPVDCFLTTNTQLNVKFRTNNFTIVPSQLETGKYYYFPVGVSCYTNDNTYYDDFQSGGYYRLTLHKTDASTMELIRTVWVGISNNMVSCSSVETLKTGVTSVKMNTNLQELGFFKSNRCQQFMTNTINKPYPNDSVPTAFTSAGYTTEVIKDIYSVDRSDSKIIKIIKLPYCPNEYSIDANNILYFKDNIWSFDTDSDLLKLSTINEKFKKEIITEYNPFEVLDVTEVIPKTTDFRDDYNESKLYHSDFYVSKFCYDSFNLGIALEKLKYDFDTDLSSFKFNFIPTTTINSKFMFELPQYKLKYATEDYPNIVSCSRSNEITLYNDAYINYIKTGYNYDVKNKDRTNTMNWIGSAVSLAGAIAGFALSPVTGGISAAAAIGLSSSFISSFANNINTNMSNETGIEQKLNQYRNQAASVSGSDDVDLMSYYCGNRAQLKYYKLSSELYKNISDLFFYCGYADNTQEVPKLNTRYWFNFIKCQPIFNEELNTPYEEYLNDIKARFNNGVTVYHRRNDVYDWNQIKENWEVELL